MKARELQIFISCFLICLVLLSIAKSHVDEDRRVVAVRLKVVAAPIPPTLLKALAGEFKGAVANYLLLEAASFVGGNIKPNEDEWSAVARLIDQSSILDPYFQQTYILAQGILPWFAQKHDVTFTILERSRKHRTWDWVPGYFLAFNHYFFFQDYKAASDALMESSRVNGAPTHLSTWASRLASQAGHYQAATSLLAGVYENTEDVKQKEMILKRMGAIKGAHRLQQAVEQFAEQYNRLPDTLEDLIAQNIIDEMPINPYKRPYSLIDGRVHF